MYSFWNLVSLRREMFLSRLALHWLESTIFPVHLTVHKYKRVCAVIHTRGISWEPSAWNSSLRSLSGVTEESKWAIVIKSLPPISLVLMQLKKQWERSAMMGAGQSLQLEVLFGRILDNLSSVGKRWWTNFHRKLVASDPNPFSLHLLHVLSQSYEYNVCT